MGTWQRTVFTFIGIGVAIWGLAVLGSEDAARDEVILRLAIACVTIAATPLVFLYWVKKSAETLDQEQRTTIAQLTDRLTPRLVLTYKVDDFHRDIKMEGRRKLGRTHYVLVKNTSEVETIKDVRVCIRSISKWTHRKTTKPLAAVAESGIFNLDPGTPVYVKVFESMDDPSVDSYWITYENDEIEKIPRESREILIVAQGLNTPPVLKLMKIDFTRGGKLIASLLDPPEDQINSAA